MLILGFDLVLLWIFIKTFWTLGVNLLVCYYGNTKVKDSSSYKAQPHVVTSSDLNSCTRRFLKIPSNPNPSVILWDGILASAQNNGARDVGHSTAASDKARGAGSDVGTEKRQEDETPSTSVWGLEDLSSNTETEALEEFLSFFFYFLQLLVHHTVWCSLCEKKLWNTKTCYGSCFCRVKQENVSIKSVIFSNSGLTMLRASSSSWLWEAMVFSYGSRFWKCSQFHCNTPWPELTWKQGTRKFQTWFEWLKTASIRKNSGHKSQVGDAELSQHPYKEKKLLFSSPLTYIAEDKMPLYCMWVKVGHPPHPTTVNRGSSKGNNTRKAC